MTPFEPVWSAPAAPFRHTWEQVGNIDQFRWLVREDVRRQLALARDELGIRYVRACAMYSEELRVWTTSLPDWRIPAGQKPFAANWQNVDYCLDGLLELGLKPIYTTCFTPAAMTDDAAMCWPDKNRTGMPRDLGQWGNFVASGLRHHLERYGLEELRSWYFECWNEPNLQGTFFGGSQADWFRLWDATYRAVKSVHPDLRFGGPSTARGEWFEAFLEYTATSGTRPDYLITHVYNNDSEGAPLSPFDGPASEKVKDSPHFASGVIRGVRRIVDRHGFKGEVHWNEWGRSWFPYDLAKETPQEAAFIVKTMAEVSQEADAFAFWCLSDVYDQVGYSSAEFQGNYGLLSLHGLRKPAWFAHVLLSRLGESRVPVSGGDGLTGAIATPASGRKPPSVLVYAYPDTLDPGRKDGETIPVVLKAPSGATRARLFRIGAKENNILDEYRKIGSPASPTWEQLASLHAANGLREAAGGIEWKPGVSGLEAHLSMERPGVALVEFEA